MARPLQRWWLTAVLFAGYLSIFHLWIGRRPSFVLVSCLVATLLLSTVLVAGFRSGFFTNRLDALTHSAIVLDVLLEGTLIPVHDSHGFYLCAAAFAAVAVGYRRWSLGNPRGCLERR